MKNLVTFFVLLLITVATLACSSDLSESEILEMLAPSVVTFRTESGRGGSGFLVEGNYVVTAAHVTWPSSKVGVLFHDGTEQDDVPVVSYDLMADLAILGPVETTAQLLPFGDGGTATEGRNIFAVGYPEGGNKLVANEGEVWRVDKWKDVNVSYVHTTARAQLGMSGGPITDGKGNVIGVLFGGRVVSSSTATSVRVIRDRLAQIANGAPVSAIGSRLPQSAEGSKEQRFVLNGRWQTQTFVFNEPEDTRVEIEVESDRRVEFAVLAPQGFSYYEQYTGNTFISTRSKPVDPYGLGIPVFLVVRQQFDLERDVTIKSSAILVPQTDPDDGRELKIGDNITGAFDTPVDIDRYVVNLDEGERFGLRFQANPITSATITIDYPGAPHFEVVSSDVGAPDWHPDGVDVLYKASFKGEYTIAIQPTILGPPSGYTLFAFQPVTTKVTSRPRRPIATKESPVGEMLRFESLKTPISISYPLNIIGEAEELLGATVFEQGRRGETVAIEELDLSFYDSGISVDRYLRSSIVATGLPLVGEKATARRELKTRSGAPVVIEDFEADGGQTKGVRLAYIHEGTTGFLAVFYAPVEVFDEWRPVVDYSIGTFAVFGETVGE